MADHFGDRVLGQVDLLSDGALLFSGSCILVYFFTCETAQEFLEMSTRRKKIPRDININCSPQKDLRPFSWGARLASEQGLDLWASLVSKMWSFSISRKPAQLDEHKRLSENCTLHFFLANLCRWSKKWRTNATGRNNSPCYVFLMLLSWLCLKVNNY